MPKPTSFFNASTDDFRTDARIRSLGLMLSKWQIEVGNEQVDIRLGTSEGSWLKSLFSQTYAITGFDYELKLTYQLGNLQGQFLDNTQVWFSPYKMLPSSKTLVERLDGRLGVGEMVYQWGGVPGKARLEVLTDDGKPILQALKPWKDSEAGVTWQIQWIDMPEDFRERMCVLLAPWVADLVAMAQTSSFG